jgi:hypothetical protein
MLTVISIPHLSHRRQARLINVSPLRGLFVKAYLSVYNHVSPSGFEPRSGEMIIVITHWPFAKPRGGDIFSNNNFELTYSLKLTHLMSMRIWRKRDPPNLMQPAFHLCYMQTSSPYRKILRFNLITCYSYQVQS